MNSEIYAIVISVRERVEYWSGAVERAERESQKEIYTEIRDMWVRTLSLISSIFPRRVSEDDNSDKINIESG